MKRIEYRVMTLEDYEPVYALWLGCAGMGINSVDDSREGIARYLRRNPTTCFGALEDETIVGVILAGHDGRRGYIYHTAVAESHRGKDIASRLVQHTLDALHKEGIIKAALVVFEKNETGNAFWEKQGFATRKDLNYRNKTLQAHERIDT